MLKNITLSFYLSFFALSAYARPPKPGTEDAAIMHDFSEWAERQYSRSGIWCCNISDGRPLHDDEIRIVDGKYQIFYSKQHWDDGTDEWIEVPSDALMKTLSPVGFTIAWVIDGHVYCLSRTGAS